MVNEEGDGMMECRTEDGVHPNDAGFSLMEALVMKGIQSIELVPSIKPESCWSAALPRPH